MSSAAPSPAPSSPSSGGASASKSYSVLSPSILNFIAASFKMSILALSACVSASPFCRMVSMSSEVMAPLAPLKIFSAP